MFGGATSAPGPEFHLAGSRILRYRGPFGTAVLRSIARAAICGVGAIVVVGTVVFLLHGSQLMTQAPPCGGCHFP